MPYPVTEYKCDFCMGVRYDTPEKAAEHEKDCIMNAAAHGCKTCSNFRKPVGWYDRQQRFTGKLERCTEGIRLQPKFKTHCPEWVLLISVPEPADFDESDIPF